MRHKGGSNVDIRLSLEPCLDARGAVVAVKARCEPVQRPLSSVVPGPTPAELRLGDDAGAQLDTALQLVGWLRQRLDTSDEPLDGERARLTYLLAEVAELVAQVRCNAVRR